MGIFDAFRARREPTGPVLDALFALPTAAITLQSAIDAVATGSGAAVFRAPDGAAFDAVEAELRGLLDADGGPPVRITIDEYGYSWLIVETSPPDLPSLVTDLHAVSRTLIDGGFGPQLLCSVVGFEVADGPVLLVYLAKRGTFYPFAPTGPDARDQVRELQIAELLGSDLPLETDRGRWFGLWGAPI